MHQSRITILILVCIFSISAFIISKLLDVITVNRDDLPMNINKMDLKHYGLTLGDTPDHLMWFIQVSSSAGKL